MCYPVQCPNCGKTSWGGCGQHVDTVMRSVPVADRCSCRDVPADGGPFVAAAPCSVPDRGRPGVANVVVADQTRRMLPDGADHRGGQ